MQNKIQISLVERFVTEKGEVTCIFTFKKFLIHYPADAAYNEKVAIIKKEIEKNAPKEVLQEFLGGGYVKSREYHSGIYVLKLIEPIDKLDDDIRLEEKRLELLLLNNPKTEVEKRWIEKQKCKPLECTKLSIATHLYDGW